MTFQGKPLSPATKQQLNGEKLKHRLLSCFWVWCVGVQRFEDKKQNNNNKNNKTSQDCRCKKLKHRLLSCFWVWCVGVQCFEDKKQNNNNKNNKTSQDCRCKNEIWWRTKHDTPESLYEHISSWGYWRVVLFMQLYTRDGITTGNLFQIGEGSS